MIHAYTYMLVMQSALLIACAFIIRMQFNPKQLWVGNDTKAMNKRLVSSVIRQPRASSVMFSHLKKSTFVGLFLWGYFAKETFQFRQPIPLVIFISIIDKFQIERFETRRKYNTLQRTASHCNPMMQHTATTN